MLSENGMRHKAWENQWYKDNIEEPVRALVRLLRNNGFNTECSCGHDMYVQCRYLLEGEMLRLHTLLADYGYTDYKIVLTIRVIDMLPVATFDLRFSE